MLPFPRMESLLKWSSGMIGSKASVGCWQHPMSLAASMGDSYRVLMYEVSYMMIPIGLRACSHVSYQEFLVLLHFRVHFSIVCRLLLRRHCCLSRNLHWCCTTRFTLSDLQSALLSWSVWAQISELKGDTVSNENQCKEHCPFIQHCWIWRQHLPVFDWSACATVGPGD